jgi:death on curing protein
VTEPSLEPDFLEVEDVLTLHGDQLRLFGGSDGIRDRGALESAVATPRASFDGAFLHADLFEMAAAYAFHIAENQAFVDGNKRTALNAALVFLDLNGWIVSDPRGDLFNAMLGLADRSVSKPVLAKLLRILAQPDVETEP